MPVIIHDENGVAISRSKNLQGVLRYARRNPVKRASVYATGEDGGGHIVFHFVGGATCRAEFASYAVAWQWVAARRSWALRLAGNSSTLRDYVAS